MDRVVGGASGAAACFPALRQTDHTRGHSRRKAAASPCQRKLARPGPSSQPRAHVCIGRRSVDFNAIGSPPRCEHLNSELRVTRQEAKGGSTGSRGQQLLRLEPCPTHHENSFAVRVNAPSSHVSVFLPGFETATVHGLYYVLTLHLRGCYQGLVVANRKHVFLRPCCLSSSLLLTVGHRFHLHGCPAA